MKDKTIQEIIQLYQDGYGVLKLCNIYGYHRSTIQKYLKRFNIKLRKRSNSLLYNTNFFDEYNILSSYWAGFIAADGNVRSDRDTVHIKLSNKDRCHLRNFLNVINAEYKVKSNENYSYININGAWFIKSLMQKYNIKPRKSLDYIPPTNIPKPYISHFIRGYFDGDGSIYLTNKIIGINFVGTSNTMDYFRNVFREELNITLKSKNLVPPLTGKGKTKLISYSGKNAKKILNFL